MLFTEKNTEATWKRISVAVSNESGDLLKDTLTSSPDGDELCMSFECYDVMRQYI